MWASSLTQGAIPTMVRWMPSSPGQQQVLLVVMPDDQKHDSHDHEQRHRYQGPDDTRSIGSDSGTRELTTCSQKSLHVHGGGRATTCVGPVQLKSLQQNTVLDSCSIPQTPEAAVPMALSGISPLNTSGV